VKYGLSVTGVVDPERMMTNRNARPGDAIVLTKALGTGFITTAARAGKCPADVLASACKSMIALNREASEAAVAAGAKAATDVTGFGLAGHAAEMARASGVTFRFDLEHLRLLPGASDAAQAGHYTRANRATREYLGEALRVVGNADKTLVELLFDPQTSGGLLVTATPKAAQAIVARCRAAGLGDAAVIGEVLEKTDADVLARA
jgi:selenide,water dikinase